MRYHRPYHRPSPLSIHCGTATYTALGLIQSRLPEVAPHPFTRRTNMRYASLYGDSPLSNTYGVF